MPFQGHWMFHVLLQHHKHLWDGHKETVGLQVMIVWNTTVFQGSCPLSPESDPAGLPRLLLGLMVCICPSGSSGSKFTCSQTSHDRWNLRRLFAPGSSDALTLSLNIEFPTSGVLKSGNDSQLFPPNKLKFPSLPPHNLLSSNHQCCGHKSCCFLPASFSLAKR